MNNKRVFKCPLCEEKYTSLEYLEEHVGVRHKEEIDGVKSIKKFIFDSKYPNKNHICVICKKNPVEWNESTGRYNRFCSESCKAKASMIAKANMVKKYGKEHLLNDPDIQRKMLNNRKISGTYIFKKGNKRTEVNYNGSYEKDFLEHLENLGFTGDDIEQCPIIFKYTLDGKERFYLPDFYMEAFNLIIEIKDGGDNPNKNEALKSFTTRLEEKKDEAVISSKNYNYIKIYNKNYKNFDELIKLLEEKPYNNDSKIYIITEDE